MKADFEWKPSKQPVLDILSTMLITNKYKLKDRRWRNPNDHNDKCAIGTYHNVL